MTRLFVIMTAMLLLFAPAAPAQQFIDWQQCRGGDSSDFRPRMALTHDGGFVMVASTRSGSDDLTSNMGKKGTWVVRLDSTGNILRQKVFTLSLPKEIIETSDHDYVLTGIGGTVRMDSSFQIIWQRPEGGYCVTETQDGGFMICASALGIALTKFDAAGNHLWNQLTDIFGPTLTWHDIDTLPGSGVMAAGVRNYEMSGLHGNVARLDDSGIVIWEQNTFPGQTMVIMPAGNGFITIGDYTSKIDATGNLIWVKPVPGVGGVVAADGSVTVLRRILPPTDFFIHQLNSNGDSVRMIQLGGSGADEPSAIVQRPGGALLLAGTTASNDGDVSGNHGLTDVWLVQLNQKVTGLDNGPFPPVEAIQVFPTPTSRIVNISGWTHMPPDIVLTDFSGRQLDVRPTVRGALVQLDLDWLQNGLYLLQIQTKNGYTVHKVLLHK